MIVAPHAVLMLFTGAREAAADSTATALSLGRFERLLGR